MKGDPGRCELWYNFRMDDYELLDSGGGRKLERFGRYVLARPCSQALWRPSLPESDWNRDRKSVV